MSKFKFQALALLGYSNTPTTCVAIQCVKTYDIAMLGYVTEGETPRMPGMYYMGSYEPHDVIILIPDENGMVEHGYHPVTHEKNKVHISDVWAKFSEEDRDTLE